MHYYERVHVVTVVYWNIVLLSQITIKHVVDTGAFGVATLYRNTNKNNLVVIKQINMLDMTAQERQLALNEAKVLSLLSHPNIIRYLWWIRYPVVYP